MSSRRLLKAAEAIREVVSMAILVELRDPRVQDVTVTGVQVAPDMRSAKVRVSIMGDEKAQQLCLHGLRSASGFLQQKVSDRIDTRYVPRLQFVLDRGVKNAIAVARILKEVLPPEEQTGPQAGAPETAEAPQSPADADSPLAHRPSHSTPGNDQQAAGAPPSRQAPELGTDKPPDPAGNR